MTITFAEMFCAIGGFRLGLEKANQKNREISPDNRKVRGNLRSDRDLPNDKNRRGRGTHSFRCVWTNNTNYSSHKQVADGNTAQGGASTKKRSKSQLPTRYRCVWANDNDKYACQIYRKHFGTEELVEGDIKTINPDTIPDHDLLTAGFPCQAYSIAGNRQGFQDPRGTLFKEIVRVAQAKRPRFLLLENVKGLLSAPANLGTGFYTATEGEGKGEITGDMRTVKDSAKRGWTEVTVAICRGYCFTEILLSLQELGYNLTEYQVLNSKHFGVPQNRERVFIVGHLGTRSAGQIFPIGCNGEKTNADGAVVRTIQGGGHSGGMHSRMTGISHSVRSGGRGSLDRHLWDIIVQPCLTPDRPKKRQHGRRFKEDGEPMFTLTGQDVHGVALQKIGNIAKSGHDSLWGRVYDPKGVSSNLNARGGGVGAKTGLYLTESRIRRLTPVECERLQSFPDNWTSEGVSKNGEQVKISDTQRYKVLGNAVTTNVVAFLGEKLLEVDGGA